MNSIYILIKFCLIYYLFLKVKINDKIYLKIIPEEIHIKPFKAAIDSGIPAIMAAHLYCPFFDKKIIPSSLSPAVIGYLRNELNFKGLVVSDSYDEPGVLFAGGGNHFWARAYVEE